MKKIFTALVLSLICLSVFASTVAEPFDPTVFEQAPENQLTIMGTSGWSLHGKTGFSLSPETDVWRYFSLCVYYESEPSGGPQENVTPKLRVQIQEIDHREERFLTPIKVRFSLGGTEYIFSGFAPVEGLDTENNESKAVGYEVPLGEDFKNMMKAMTETEKVHITVTYDSGKTISSGCKVDPSKSCSEWLLFNQLLDESHAWENMSSAALEKAKEFVTVE